MLLIKRFQLQLLPRPAASPNHRRPPKKRRGGVRQASLLVLVPLLLTGLGTAIYWGWQVVRQSAPLSAEYGLRPGDIEIVPESKWLDRDELLKKVVHGASLDDRLSVLDPGLNERISLAFRDHPWVEQVVRVEKFQPPRIRVALVYREPIAIVEAAATGHSEAALPYVVDRHGIYLPVENFVREPAVLQGLARIRNAPPRPPAAGKRWKDGRVRGGAKIAAAFGPLWGDFSLLAIEPSPQPILGSTETYDYDLVTRGGKRIGWGPQYVDAELDSDSRADEPTAEAKVARLKNYVTQHRIDLDGNPLAPPRNNPAGQPE
jgi:hypothetical protein